MVFLNWFATGADKPLIEDTRAVTRIYERKRFLVFWSLVIGYSFFYVCRLSISVAKKPLIDAEILNADQLGVIGSALFFTYAFGKLTNGFLADRSNVGRFIATGLFVSSAIVILFGFTHMFWVFVVLWGVSGWFQAMGAAPCGAAISQWFSNKERGTRYGIWSTAHSLGEGATFYVTASIVAWYGWQWGFWSAGGVSLLVALVLFATLADRPRTYGLPAIADYKNDHTAETRDDPISVNRAQWEVIKNPYVWILGLSCAAMYVGRYGIDNWGILFLQESKGYTLKTAGSVFFLAKMVETLGALSSGFVSDYLFRARRNVVTLAYGMIEIAGLLLLFAGPSTHLATLDISAKSLLREGAVDSALRDALSQAGVQIPDDARLSMSTDEKKIRWYAGSSWQGCRIEETEAGLDVSCGYRLTQVVGLVLFGFGLGGLLVFLGGLIAIDICSKRASGAAMGLVGMFSYLGASLQERITGRLLEAGKMTVNGATTHDFTDACSFWLGAAIVAVALSCALWNVKAKD